MISRFEKVKQHVLDNISFNYITNVPRLKNREAYYKLFELLEIEKNPWRKS
jgi:hypothetical protein